MAITKYLNEDGARYLVQKVKDIIAEKKYTFASLEEKPTTLSGYGIVDAVTPDALNNFVEQSTLANYVTKQKLEEALAALNPEAVHDANGVADAVNAEEPKVDIQVTADISMPQGFTVEAGKEVNIDLGQSTLSIQNPIVVEGKMTICGDGVITAGNTPLILQNGGEVVLESGNIISEQQTAIEVQTGSTFTMNGGTVDAQEFGILPRFDGSEVNINGGLIKTRDNVAVGNNGTIDPNRGGDHGGTVINITGGRLESHITTPGYVACGVYMANHGVLNISGGEIVAIGGCGICQRAGIVNITGGTISGSGNTSLLGKVGDSRVVVGPNGIVYDQSAKYPGINVDAPDNGIHLNIYGGTITGKNSSIQVLKEEDFAEDINVYGGLLVPSYE